MDQATQETPAPIGAVAEAIAARIATEQDRQTGEQAIEQQLTIERKRLLTAGTDKETSACEQRIDASRAAQARIAERITLLTSQLQEANAAAVSENLDRVADLAHRLVEDDKRLIRDEYTKQAKIMAAILTRLAIGAAAIERCNGTLHSGGRPTVEASNIARCTPSRYVAHKVTVTINPNDPRHPMFGQVSYSVNRSTGEHHWSGPQGVCVEPVEIVEDRRDLIGGFFPDPLYEVITLPAAEPEPYAHKTLPKLPSPKAYFDPNDMGITDAHVSALLADLSGEQQAKAKKAA